MTITKLEAWTIFRADKLGHEEGKAGIKSLQGTDWGAYHLHAEEFQMRLAEIGIEAQNEGASISEAHPELKYLEVIRACDWVADDYIAVVSVFKGSKHERLHLSALFRINNSELLLDLVKP